MSRWKSPKVAARLAQREVEKAERLRREKRKSILLVSCIGVLSAGLMVADFLWLRHKSRQRQQLHQHYQQSENTTNAPVTGLSGQTPQLIEQHE